MTEPLRHNRKTEPERNDNKKVVDNHLRLEPNLCHDKHALTGSRSSGHVVWERSTGLSAAVTDLLIDAPHSHQIVWLLRGELSSL